MNKFLQLKTYIPKIDHLHGKILFNIGIFIVLFSILYGPVTILPNASLSFGLTSLHQIIIGFLFLIISSTEKSKNITTSISLGAFFCLTLYLFSDVFIKKNGFLENAPIGFTIIIYISLFTITFLSYNYISKYFSYLIILSSMISGLVPLVTQTYNKLIFTDDHPCFLYRLTQLKEHFPNIPFYNPEWNAGVEAREFFASGILNVFFLFSPLIYVFKVENIYSLIVSTLLFIIPPISIFWAGKNFKMSFQAISIAICLSLSHSLFWYRWALSYGTLGFILSMILVPLTLSYLTLLADKDYNINKKTLIILPLVTTLMLLWSLSGILILPAAIFTFFLLKTSKNKLKILIIFLTILLLNIPWMTIFYQASNVGNFIQANKTSILENNINASNTETKSFDVSKFKANDNKSQSKTISQNILYTIRSTLLPSNPIVLIFGLSGLFMFLPIKKRGILITFFITAMLLGFVVSIFKPHLELERMIIAMTLVLALPAGQNIANLIHSKDNRLISSLLISLVFILPLWIWNVASNNSPEKYKVETPLLKNLAEDINKFSNNGRVLFSGFSLHELNGGHLAPLPLWVKQPLIASSFQHDKWNYTDVIPVEFRKRKLQGALEYIKLMNVSLVVSNNKFWRKWFRSHPQHFEEVQNHGVFSLFKVKNFTSNYFLEGSGDIISQENGKIILNVKSEHAVINFNYLPFLETKNCVISPYKVGNKINFIKLSNCRKDTEVVIKSESILTRFFSKLN